MLLALILVPLLAAFLAMAIPSNRWRPWVLVPASLIHLALAVSSLSLAAPSTSGWLALDPPGRLVLLTLSVLFVICSFYSIGYLRYRTELSNRVFVMCLLIFLAMTTLVTCARHLGLMWVAVEATALTTAPLIYFNRTPRQPGNTSSSARLASPSHCSDRSFSPMPRLGTAVNHRYFSTISWPERRF
jgi:hydrogenase-4 component F